MAAIDLALGRIVLTEGRLMSVQVRRSFLLIAVGFLLASLIVAMAAPNLLRWRMENSERSAPQELRQIDEAVKAYITERGAPPATLSSLRGRIAPELSCGTPACDYVGYRFQYTVSSQDPGKPSYTLSARPLHQGLRRVRSFHLDQTGILRCTPQARAATSNDPAMPLCGER